MLDVFSAEHGRTAMVARGARRGKSAQALILQPYHKLMLSWVARSDLGTLTSVESAGINYQLTGSQSFAGFYINELTLRLLDKQESHGDLFAAYENVLQHLVRNDDQESCLRNYELKLLEATGFGLVLDHDVRTGMPVDAEEEYYYIFEHGPIKADSLTHADHVEVSGTTLQALAAGSFTDEQSRREAKILLRREIERHLRGKPLASRDLYMNYKKYSEQT